MKSILYIKGFTLIELLIVIAVVGALAAGVVIAIDPIGKINLANLAKAETFSASIYNNLAFNLVGEWTFDGNVNDISGYGNNATGGTVCSTFASDRRNRTNRACSFNGTSNYINIGTNSSLNFNNQVTVEGWFYYYTAAVDKNIYGAYSSDGERLVNLRSNAFDVRPSGSTYCETNWAPVSANRWHHLAGIYDGNKVRAYADGVPIGTPSNCSGSLGASLANWIGADPFSGGRWYMPGLIDDVRIYNQALLSFQVEQLYAQGLAKHQLIKTN